jgi:hypothetical protein
MKKLSFILVAMCLWACSAEDVETLPSGASQQSESEYFRSPQDAMKIAEGYFASLDEGTRASMQPLSTSVIRGGQRTRAALGTDTLSYVVQRGDDDGFVIVAADSRVDELLAYSPTGRFSYEESDDDVVYAEFVSNIEPYIEKVTEAPVSTTDSLDDGVFVWDSFVVTDEAKWSQLSPYNYYVNIEHPDCPVGCGPVAMGMAMMYCTDTLTYHGEFFDFQKIRYCMNFSSDQVPDDGFYTQFSANRRIAKLLYYIGEDVGVSYGTTISTCETLAMCDYLYEVNLSLDYCMENYEPKKLAKSMNEHQSLAVIVGNASSNCHAWLIDGYRFSYPHLRTSEPLDTTYMQNVALHCNWGAGGSSNGFYSGNVLHGWTPKVYMEVGTYRKSKYNSVIKLK